MDSVQLDIWSTEVEFIKKKKKKEKGGASITDEGEES
jgi:hypothetical protein